MAEQPPSTVGAFLPFAERNSDSGEVDYIQSITAQDAYSNFSFEELRLIDTQQGIPHAAHLAVALLTDAPLPRPTESEGQGDAVPARSALGSSIIIFKVGADTPTDFAVHESLVVQSSRFVRSSLTQEWREAQDCSISLPEDDPQVFQLYQDWLYDRKVYTKAGSTDYKLLVKAYISGEKLMDIGFKNDVIREIIRVLRTTSLFDLTLTNLVYDNTPPNSPLRRLFRDIYAWLGSEAWFDDDQLPHAISGKFLRDVNREQMRLRRHAPPSPPFANHLSVTSNYIESEMTYQQGAEAQSPPNLKRKRGSDDEAGNANKRPVKVEGA